VGPVVYRQLGFCLPGPGEISLARARPQRVEIYGSLAFFLFFLVVGKPCRKRTDFVVGVVLGFQCYLQLKQKMDNKARLPTWKVQNRDHYYLHKLTVEFVRISFVL